VGLPKITRHYLGICPGASPLAVVCSYACGTRSFWVSLTTKFW